LTLYSQAREIELKLRGLEIDDVSLVKRRAIAYCTQMLGRHAEAQARYETILADRERLAGKEHVDLAGNQRFGVTFRRVLRTADFKPNGGDDRVFAFLRRGANRQRSLKAFESSIECRNLSIHIA
jgi:hypothetical protein